MTELYLFQLDSEYIALNPGSKIIAFEGRNYLPTKVKRSNYIKTDNFAKSTINFTFTIDNVFALRILNHLPESPITIVIYRNNTIYYQGRVVNISGSKTTMEFECDSLYSILRTPTVNAVCSINCSHRVYDSGCTLNKTNWQNSFSVSGITTKIITIPINSSTTNFTGGTVEINQQTREILLHSGTTITIDYVFTGSQTGTMTITRGCNLTPENCKLFNNFDNYLGFQFIPVKNPFSSTGAL